ncbi:glycosyltransferase family 4 protein [Flammeovirga kamogawensis]|uniref:Glycosyltransferase family 4 protein n=1 Tax=Flammeovirga kamogawensis TaxID=373891 RepID=A0ABX8H306_9BACT|nr:glycosyltransferase family 1 protein [Flammeovirga kamogawensis]MBB6460216.1 glycosyltransferase involved in cell wall biosynthesis [Flammeovirga kamogawensis]QWG10028.1 glycosyltransferase family 4 protein [Flammeovirga kamogawensis]TRX65536.1 glycosyltransferase family 4 protein [Flammeovirga kamogawensis]
MMSIEWLSCVEKGCGIGQYSAAICEELFNRNVNVALRRKGDENKDFVKNYSYRSLRGFKDYIAPYYLKKCLQSIHDKPMVWHADNIDAFTGLLWSKKHLEAIKVVTIHDVIPIVTDQIHSWKKIYYNYQLNKSLNQSDLIVTVSEYSKQDIIRHTSVEPKKIKVVYNGINHELLKPIFKKNNKKFTIAYLGGLGAPHKNAKALIEVANILEKRGREFTMKIGSGNAQLTPLPGLVEKYNLKNIQFVGFIEDSLKPQFLGEADLFLFTSKYEGFGLPPLEAMACGTATISTGNTSLKEVLNDGAILTSTDPEDIANKVELLMDDTALRLEYQNKGIERASKFSWKKSVDQLMDEYKKLV